MPDLVHIYWDNSNIFIGSQFAAHKREAGFAQRTEPVKNRCRHSYRNSHRAAEIVLGRSN